MNFQELKKALPSIKENITLAEYTTFKIGGAAKYFFAAKNKEDLINAAKIAKQYNLQFFILGGGSNLLIRDAGFDGMVIKIRNEELKIIGQELKIIYAEAGVSLANLVGFSNKEALTGLEWAAGIPGSVGGAARGNAGAFAGSIGDIIKQIEVFDADKQELKIFQNKDCKFNYRGSIFKTSSNLIILSVEIALKEGNRQEIEKKIINNVDYRNERHPLCFPSAGCAFQNCAIEEKFALRQFPELEEFKRKGIIPTGFLLDKCGLKGKMIGRAQFSEKHPNFIVNLGGASSKDVLELIALAKEKVKEKFGIELKEEIQIVC